MRDTKEWWFYWNFGVRGTQGKTLTFEFTNGNPIGSRGVATSLDNGKTWQWLGVKNVKRSKEKASFTYSFPKSATDVRFACCIPYLPKDFDEFLRRLKLDSFKKIQLCKTRKSRQNFAYSFGNQNGKIKIFLTSRHHACETTGTFVMQGIIDEFLKDKKQSNKVEIIAVPFVDLDGVLDGDQRKSRKPFDQNRDYLNEPSRYPTVGAIKKLHTKKADECDVIISLDLHAPWIFRGGENNTNNMTYFVEIPKKEKSQALREFCKILESKTVGLGKNSIKYKLAWNVKYRTMWNKNPKNTKFSA